MQHTFNGIIYHADYYKHKAVLSKLNLNLPVGMKVTKLMSIYRNWGGNDYNMWVDVK